MRPTLTIDRHLPCIACGYDLRTLAASSACPECGRPVAATLLQPLAVADADGTLRRSDLHLLAELAGYPVDGVRFIRDALRRAGPGRVADAFARHCRTYFNDHAEAVAMLDHWGLRSAADVGRIVSALVDVGQMTAADRPEQFVGPLALGDWIDDTAILLTRTVGTPGLPRKRLGNATELPPQAGV